MGKTDKLHAAAAAYGDAKDALERAYGNVDAMHWRALLETYQAAHTTLLAAAREFAEASRADRTGTTEEPAAA